MTIQIEYYDDDARRSPIRTASAKTPREARKIAAEMLGHGSLRGASTWERVHGGTVFKFGPRTESNGYPFAVIIWPGGESRDNARDDYDAPA